MYPLVSHVALLLGITLLSGIPLQADEKGAPVDGAVPVDSATGLKMGEDWKLIRDTCLSCHSAGQFLQQRGTRRTWFETMRWMQKTQGLRQFDKDTERRILDYLEEHHGPTGVFRRAPIPPALMPVNPYRSD